MMTEAEWLVRDDPLPMLTYLRGQVSERKLRLYACACCRGMWDWLTDERSRVAVEKAERFTDGRATAEELAACYRPARKFSIEWARQHPEDPRQFNLIAPADAAATCPFDAARTGALDAGWGSGGGERLPGSTSYAALADLVRDIFGNPFRPVSPGPWITPAAVSVAQDIYDRRDFAALPVLADLLEEAGCPDQSVLDHCRLPGEHARGCWAVDLILGKS
jgi:hypothetical protein